MWNIALKQRPSGWWHTYPSAKYESQLGRLFPIYGEKMFQTNQPYIWLDTYDTWPLLVEPPASIGPPFFKIQPAVC